MVGHGSPLGMHGRGGLCSIGAPINSKPFGLAVRVVFIALLAATVGPARGDDSVRMDEYKSLDQYTAPFQLRVAGAADPIAVASTPGPLTIAVRGLDQHAQRSGTLRFELVRVEDRTVVRRVDEKVQLDARGDVSPLTVLENVPDSPGVYEVRCRLTADRNPLWSRIAGDRPLSDESRFPLLVVPASPRTNVGLTTVLRLLASVEPYDPEAWRTPAWVPEGASKLVPSVNQLVPDPWTASRKGAAEEGPETLLCTIEPEGESVFKLPQMEAHRRHLISFAIRQRRSKPDGDGTSTAVLSGAAGQIEVASNPEFVSVTRQSAISVPQFLSDADNDDERCDLVHYSTGGQEFLKVRNPSPRLPLELRSIEVYSAMEEETVETSSLTQRSAIVRMTSSDWMQRLTSDLGGLKDQGFADATVAMFRVWKSAQRVSENASWFGYDALMVPPHGKDEFVRAHSIEALRQWLAPDGIAVEDRDSLNVPIATIELPASPSATSVSRQCRASSATSELSQFARASAERLMIRLDGALPTVTRSFRRSLREFRHLPVMNSHPLPPVDEASRYVHAFWSELDTTGRGAKRRLVSFVNTATWSASVELRCCASGEADCERLLEHEIGASTREGRTANVCVIDLPPLGIVNVVVTQNASSLDELAWRAVTNGPDVLQQIQSQVGQVVAKIGMLTQPGDYAGLRNGGFEDIGPVGIVGWMSTQFPETAVVVDSAEAVEGEQSIRMTTTKSSAGRTWLVSEPIEIPKSGRLGVSLAVRAAVQLEVPGPSGQLSMGSSHRVRISLEGNRRGRAIRHTDHFEIPRNGQWQSRRLVLETDGLDDDTEFVRLTIDSLSPGQIWIDDIHLHDHFPTQAERTALQGSAFLAIQGLQKGRLQEAADLLRNDWSQHLLSNRIRRWPTSRTVSHQASTGGNHRVSASQRTNHDVQLRSGVQPRTAGKGRNSADAEPRPSVAERIRSWLPKPLRF